MSEDKWTLEPLGDSNWGNWSFKLKNILCAKDLWGLADGSEKLPANDANEEAKLKYKRNCNRAIREFMIHDAPYQDALWRSGASAIKGMPSTHWRVLRPNRAVK